MKVMGEIVHLGIIVSLLILFLEYEGEKKKMASKQRGRTDRRLIIRGNWVEIDFHLNHSDYIWPTNEWTNRERRGRRGGGDENKWEKIKLAITSPSRTSKLRGIKFKIPPEFYWIDDRSIHRYIFVPEKHDITGSSSSLRRFPFARIYTRTHELLNRVTRVETNTCVVRWRKEWGESNRWARKEGRKGEARAV